MTRNAAMPRQIERMQRRERRAAAALRSDLVAVLALPSGRRVVVRIVEELAGVSGSCTRSGFDPIAIAWHEGRRSVGRELMQLALEASPELFSQLVAEDLQAARRDHVSATDSDSDPTDSDPDSAGAADSA